jgi:hypothetical protein
MDEINRIMAEYNKANPIRKIAVAEQLLGIVIMYMKDLEERLVASHGIALRAETSFHNISDDMSSVRRVLTEYAGLIDNLVESNKSLEARIIRLEAAAFKAEANAG